MATAAAFLAALNRRIASIPSATLSITIDRDNFTVTALVDGGRFHASTALGPRALRRAVDEQTLERLIDRVIDDLVSALPRQSTQQTVNP